ncbi:ketopantoate reductase family protein [uncultured Parasutterella sp.]|uniref:ketopantoate reductase family protein n=1 Tax=uncultured Parasutterella sp. TaxID=1263098 RepID=UPI00272DBFA3|nr:2-dehydropantoate 2-reductase [uncultured Parasutterella sp.]
MTIQSAAILGRGALGVMYGSFLSPQLPSEQTYFLAEPHRVERYRQERITVNGTPANLCFKSPKELNKAPDLLIVALKAPVLRQALRLVKDAVDQNTIVVSVMNGISSEDIIAEELGLKKIVHCVAQRMDALFQNNTLTYRTFGELVIGLSPQNRSQIEALQDTVEFFRRTQMPHLVDSNIIHRMWCKWMLNVGVNQTLSVYNGCFEMIHKPGEARDVMIGAMREVLKLSELEGTGLSEKDFKEYLKIIDELNPKGMPSMRQDRLAKRPTEVESFAGTVIDKAASFGLNVPFNEKLYRQVRQFEAEYLK